MVEMFLQGLGPLFNAWQARPTRWAAPSLLVLCGLLASCAESRYLKQADDAFERGAYEEAVEAYQAGLRDTPDSTPLRSGLLRRKQDAQVKLLEQAQRALTAGDTEAARRLLNRASALDPGQPRVRALLNDVELASRQAMAMDEARAYVEQQRPDLALVTIANALKDNPKQPALLALRRQLEDEARLRESAASREVLAQGKPISLDFRDASLRTVLDLITRHSGVNYVVDRDVRAEMRVTLLLQNAQVEDALDLLLATNQLAKKVVDARTILVYPNTPEKAKEYQEQVVRVFYLSSGEARGAAAFLRAMLKVAEPFVDERTNMLALRDSAENIRLAERLIGLFDTAEPEVVLELEVLEVSSRRLTELGVRVPDSISLTLLPPVGATGLTLGTIEPLTRSRVGLGIGGALINLKREVGDFSTLANPQIRVKNREKAKVLVGDKIPVISTVTGQAGFVSDSISYLDVGLKLEVEPQVYADDDVGIKVALEVSTLGTAVRTQAGALAYQIGTRNATTSLRLRDGETQVLAGLISKEERTSANRIPGAGDLPVLGRLFSSTADNAQRTELVLAITPRVLRNVNRPSVSESEIWIGTEARPGLRTPRLAVPPASKAASSPAAPSATPASDAPVLGLQPPSPGSPLPNAQPDSTSPAAHRPPVPAPTPPVLLTPMRLSWVGPESVAKGQVLNLALQVDQAANLRALPMEIVFDPTQWAYLGVEEGDFMSQGQTPTSLVPNSEPKTGLWSMSILRRPATGANGAGKVLTLKLRALKAGDASISVRAAKSVNANADVAPIEPLPQHRVRITD